MSHNHHGSGKGLRKSSNPARKRRREKSQGALREKKARRVLDRNGPEALAYWNKHGTLPKTQAEIRFRESAARMMTKHAPSLKRLAKS